MNSRRRLHDFEMLITQTGDVLRGSNGRRWKALTLSFPTTPWSTYFDLKTLSYGQFELGSFFFVDISRHIDVLRGSNGRRWKALTLSFPTTPWTTYFDLKKLSYGKFELGSLCRLRRVIVPPSAEIKK